MTLLNISTSQPPSQSATQDDIGKLPALVPSYAYWYQRDQVDDIERRAMPDLLPTDTPAAITAYTAIRDFMVDQSRQRPNEYLTVAYCRRLLNADIGTIYKIHAFLEQWGMINYQVNVSLPQQQNNEQVPVVLVQSKMRPIPEGVKIDTIVTGRVCAVCKAECQTGFYCLIKQTSAILCDGCFADGKLFDNTHSADYQHCDTPKSVVDKDTGRRWSEEEELRLLEAIEQHSNDWQAIADVVGRSKESCLLHFLQLDTLPSEVSIKEEDTSNDIPKVSPFAHLDNPVIGTIAFLASLVHPKVAAAAAKSAIQTLSADVHRNEAAAVAAFSMAASKANELASEEERIIQQLRDAIVLTQMKKVQLKLSYLESLERNVLEEKAELEKQRMVLFLERVNLKKAIMGMEGRFVKRADADHADPADDVQMHVISDNTKQ